MGFVTSLEEGQIVDLSPVICAVCSCPLLGERHLLLHLSAKALLSILHMSHDLDVTQNMCVRTTSSQLGGYQRKAMCPTTCVSSTQEEVSLAVTYLPMDSCGWSVWTREKPPSFLRQMAIWSPIQLHNSRKPETLKGWSKDVCIYLVGHILTFGGNTNTDALRMSHSHVPQSLVAVSVPLVSMIDSTAIVLFGCERNCSPPLVGKLRLTGNRSCIENRPPNSKRGG